MAPPQGSVVVIPIKAVAGLKYDPVRFRVKPGATVRLVLTNADDMAHNLLITQPGKREDVVKQAEALGDKGPAMNYIPKSGNVLWSIPLVNPGQSNSVTFTVPEEEGVYPYVCTFPGHGWVMYGAMYVTTKSLPSLKDDPNVPHLQTETTAAAHASHEPPRLHPYTPVPPYLYRILMPDSGPASIAVSLPKQLSYCWDAGSCRLRYAWQGAFLDPLDYWDKKGEPYARVSGTVFYRDKSTFPLRTGSSDHIPGVSFKGYRLVNRYPEFRYYIDDLEVTELIREKADGSGLERTFHITNATSDTWFVYEPADGVTYTTSIGTFHNGQLKLSPQEAQEFTITMTKTETLP